MTKEPEINPETFADYFNRVYSLEISIKELDESLRLKEKRVSDLTSRIKNSSGVRDLREGVRNLKCDRKNLLSEYKDAYRLFWNYIENHRYTITAVPFEYVSGYGNSKEHKIAVAISLPEVNVDLNNRRGDLGERLLLFTRALKKMHSSVMGNPSLHKCVVAVNPRLCYFGSSQFCDDDLRIAKKGSERGNIFTPHKVIVPEDFIYSDYQNAIFFGTSKHLVGNKLDSDERTYSFYIGSENPISDLLQFRIQSGISVKMEDLVLID